MSKTRLDLLLMERGLAESRAKAQALIMAGQVRVDGQVQLKASIGIPPEAQLELEMGPRFVSRGGDKLEAALTAFPIRVEGRTCADVGASTGGFTDCLLQHGAVKVYAIDVGKGILHWKLRSDPHVVVMEETNARNVKTLPEPVSLVTMDASFISLKILLPVVKGWLSSPTPLIPPAPLLSPKSGERRGGETGKLDVVCGDTANNIQFADSFPQGRGDEMGRLSAPELSKGEVIALIKPQFEAGKRESAKHKGVIRDPAVHKSILEDVLSFAQDQGFGVRGLLRSPVLGPKGNVEFLAWLGVGGSSEDVPAMVVQALGT
jgi:TlyA family rRNA methyltransferase/putative hemolysin